VADLPDCCCRRCVGNCRRFRAFLFHSWGIADRSQSTYKLPPVKVLDVPFETGVMSDNWLFELRF